MYKNRIQQGKEGEQAFAKWLNIHRIPYLHIEQERNSLSKGLKEMFGAKRPDFVVLIESIGLILIDVKNEIITAQGEFSINRDDLIKYANLEKHSNFKVWFVISNAKVNYEKWYWIQVDKAQKNNREKKVFQGKRFMYTCMMVPTGKCAVVDKSDGIDILFSKLRSNR